MKAPIFPISRFVTGFSVVLALLAWLGFAAGCVPPLDDDEPLPGYVVGGKGTGWPGFPDLPSELRFIGAYDSHPRRTSAFVMFEFGPCRDVEWLNFDVSDRADQAALDLEDRLTEEAGWTKTDGDRSTSYDKNFLSVTLYTSADLSRSSITFTDYSCQ